MPFKSKAQQRFMFAAESRGEVPKGTASRWAHHTKSIKKLPEKVHEKKGDDMKSIAYRMGHDAGMEKQSMAWLGRKVVMPAVGGAAKGLEWLLSKLHAPSGAAVGKYRAGLRGAASVPGSSLQDVTEGRLARALKAEAEGKEGPRLWNAKTIDKAQARFESGQAKQRAYGAAGAAAVGVPALAGVIAGVSSGRRRRAEQALKDEMESQESKEGSVNKAQKLGFELGLAKGFESAKQANILGDASRSIGRTVTPALARVLETVGAKETGHGLRRSARLSGAAGERALTHGELPEEVRRSTMAWRRAEPASTYPKMHHAKQEMRLAPKVEAADKTMRNIGIGTAATGAAAGGAVAGGVAGGKAKKKKKEEKGEKKEAQLGTPFMDGFLMQCAQAGLDEKGTANAIEKAAQAGGKAGEECKAFLERLAACDD